MISIGTAGWSIPRDCADAFPGEGTHLERYAARMRAVEVNSSFYRPHRSSTYQRWGERTPDDFRFAVKLPKAITHTARLAEPEAVLDGFVGEVAGLAAKLGVILAQLPPSLAFDEALASAFFAALRIRLDDAVAIACEPRHATWFTGAAERCLIEQRIARVAADPVLAPGGGVPGGWQGLRYRRLHGAPRMYYSAYDPGKIAALAAAIAGDREAGVPSWCIFDNTAAGAALDNAMQLQALL